MTRVAAGMVVPLGADAARALWLDTSRWPAFVDGFSHVVRADPEWPEAGALTWQSKPHGRGRVIERVLENRSDAVVGEVEDERLAGTQTVAFEPRGDSAAAVSVALEYRLKERTPLTPLLDLLFIRRAMRDALTRTVQRYAREAASDAKLGGRG